MNLSCNREALLTACSAAGAVVNQRSPKPITRNLLLNPTAKTVSATDLEISLVYNVSGIKEASGEPVCIPAAELLSILRELDDETISIESTQGGIRISGLTSEFELQTTAADEFPSIATEIKYPSSINAGVLAKLISCTSFAVAKENSRYALSSVAFDLNGKITAVATDGKRLAMHPGAASIHEKSESLALLSPKSLSALARIIIDPEESVEFECGKDSAVFKVAKATLWTRLVEGRFPRYIDVLPPPAKHKIPLPVGKFCTLLRQAKILTSEESKGVEFEFASGTLTLKSISSQRGKSAVRMPVAFDDELKTTLDPQYVLDGMRVLDAESSVTLELVDKKRAVLFRQGDFQFVVMPLTREKERA